MASPISKKIIYRAVDPEGFEVYMEKECWYGHILKNHKKQMIHRLYDIKSTIEQPDYVDDRLENGVRNRVYFKKWSGRDPYGQQFLKVPTQIVADKISRVLTAHPTPVVLLSSRRKS